MSLPPLQPVPQRGHRLLTWAAAIVIVALIFAVLSFVYSRFSGNEQRKADEEIAKYLSLVQGRDHSGADAMLCGGDDTTTAKLRDTDEPDSGLRRIEAFAIVSAWGWSSATDGHGRTYRVRLTFANGSTATSDLAVEVIANEPCIATEIPF